MAYERMTALSGEELDKLQGSLLELVFERSTMAIFGVDIETEKLIATNPVSLRLWGYDSPSEVLGRHIYEFISPDYRPMLAEAIEHFKYGEGLSEFEAPMQRKNGKLFWARFSLWPLHVDGKSYVFGMGYDVVNELYRIIVDNINRVLNGPFHPDDDAFPVLGVFCKHLGAYMGIYYRIDSDGSIMSWGCPQDVAKMSLKPEYLDWLENGEDFFVEFVEDREHVLLFRLNVEPNVRRLAMFRSCNAFLDMEMYRDVMEDIKSYIELILRNFALYNMLSGSQERLLKIVDFLPNGVVLISHEHKIVFWNKSAEKIFGIPSEFAIDSLVYSLFRTERFKQRAIEILELAEKGEDQLGIEWNVIIDGKEKNLVVHLKSLVADCETLKDILAIAVIDDVTERKSLESRLEQQERLAALGELAAGIAHEINNPLQGIMSLSELLKYTLESLSVEPKVLGQIDVIIKESERIGNIVKNLLQLGRPDTGRYSEYSLNDVVRDVHALMRKYLESDDIDVVVDLNDDIPQIEGVKHAVFQILINFLTNARDAVIASKKTPRRIRISTSYDSSSELPVKLSVEDSGDGISKEIAPKIFDPFFSTKRPDSGTGLGLSISMRLAKQQGGEITISNSSLLGGSMFTLHLPLSAPNLEPQPL